jgi:hypothetical protein
MLPVLGREVIERQQAIPVLRELLHGFRILCLVRCDECFERCQGIGTSGGHEDVLHGRLRSGLLRRWQRIQHITQLMEPASLGTGGRKHLFQRSPETHGAIANRQQRASLQPACLQTQ